MSNVQTLRVVEGGLSRPESRHQALPRTARAPRRARASIGASRWLDFLPMALLGLSAGVAGVIQIVSAVAH